jgi:hypothetical protein
MKRNVIVFGLISGAIISSWMVYMVAKCSANPEFESNDVLGYAGMIAAFSFIFVGIRNHREKYNGGFISFGKAFQVGFFISLVASTLYVVVGLINYYVFFPDFIDSYIRHVLYMAKINGATQAEIDQKAVEMANFKEMYKNPLFALLITYAEVLPVGLVISLISALLLKRKPKTGNVAVG